MSSNPADGKSEGASARPFSLPKLLWFPFLILAAMERRSFLPFMAEFLSLPPNLLRKGRSVNLRQSTQDRALRNLMARAETTLGGKGDPRWQRFQAWLECSPGRKSTELRPFADMTHMLGLMGDLPLPLATAQAERIDRFLIAAINAHKRQDLDAFKALFVGYDWGSSAKAGESPARRAKQQQRRFEKAANWEEALEAVRGYEDELLYGWLAAVDVESGAKLFAIYEPRPLGLLMAPRFNPAFDLRGAKPFSQRNAIFRPQRRCLELCYAVLYRQRHKAWPDKAPGRSELGASLTLSDGSVGNLFDGTAKLRLNDLVGKWHLMTESLGNEERYKPPVVLMMIALLMEATFIKNRDGKLESVIKVDAKGYRRLWQWHRDEWAKQLPPAGTIAWPDWLSDQLWPTT